MKKIIYLLKKQKKKRSKFCLCFNFITPDGKVTSSIKKLKGNISTTIKGSKGFGYDSIFIPKRKKKTFGEIARKKK